METAAVISLIPVAMELIKLAEGLFKKKKSGKKKKAFVTKKLKNIYSDVEAISTGGQKESLTALKPVSSKAIDKLAGKLFPSGK